MTNYFETKQVEKSVVSRTRCDSCGQEVYGSNPEYEGFATIESSHSDWGNDSVESCKCEHACSLECYEKILTRIAREYEPGIHPTLQVHVDMGWEFLNRGIPEA